MYNVSNVMVCLIFYSCTKNQNQFCVDIFDLKKNFAEALENYLEF